MHAMAFSGMTGKMQQYYDPKRDGLIDGIYTSSELLAFLRDVVEREAENDEFKLSGEGAAGLWVLLSMVQQCVHDISRQLHRGEAWRSAAALYNYLSAYPEAESELRQFLDRARCQGFTGWDGLQLD